MGSSALLYSGHRSRIASVGKIKFCTVRNKRFSSADLFRLSLLFSLRFCSRYFWHRFYLIKIPASDLSFKVEFCLFKTDEGRGHFCIDCFFIFQFKAYYGSGVIAGNFQFIINQLIILPGFCKLKIFIKLNYKIVFKIIVFTGRISGSIAQNFSFFG